MGEPASATGFGTARRAIGYGPRLARFAGHPHRCCSAELGCLRCAGLPARTGSALADGPAAARRLRKACRNPGRGGTTAGPAHAGAQLCWLGAAALGTIASGIAPDLGCLQLRRQRLAQRAPQPSPAGIRPPGVRARHLAAAAFAGDCPPDGVRPGICLLERYRLRKSGIGAGAGTRPRAAAQPFANGTSGTGGVPHRSASTAGECTRSARA
jgi:hypothetical protein